MDFQYSIKVYKQYFNFAAAHFLTFTDGSREPLHGHNYRVAVMGEAPTLKNDMVFDFLDIKPIVREICNTLDHKVILPGECEHLKIYDENANWKVETHDESYFSLPKNDVLILPLHNTSSERLAIYLCEQIITLVKSRFSFEFSQLEVEVEETPGQSAVYRYRAKS